jgi:hypothetical protein
MQWSGRPLDDELVSAVGRAAAALNMACLTPMPGRNWVRSNGTYRRAQWDIRSNPEEQRLYLVGMDITDHEPIVTGKRVLVGSWDWHIPTNTATWSNGMFEIYGIPPGKTYSPAGRVFRGENGDPQRMRGLTWDVTERPGSRVPG